MDMLNSEAVRGLLLFIPPFILSLSFHEFAHAWVADKLGDSTARYLGRLTMDPMAHASLMGTVIFPAIAFLTHLPLFGWANPVPVDARNFRKPRAHMALVAAAGPVSNIFLATLSTAILAVVVKRVDQAGHGMAYAAVQMLLLAVQLNLFLAFFNLIPLPPLDGSRIVQGIVSAPMAQKIEGWSTYGGWILMGLAFTGGLRFIGYPVLMFMDVLFRFFGINE